MPRVINGDNTILFRPTFENLASLRPFNRGMYCGFVRQVLLYLYLDLPRFMTEDLTKVFCHSIVHISTLMADWRLVSRTLYKGGCSISINPKIYQHNLNLEGTLWTVKKWFILHVQDKRQFSFNFIVNEVDHSIKIYHICKNTMQKNCTIMQPLSSLYFSVL